MITIHLMFPACTFHITFAWLWNTEAYLHIKFVIFCYNTFPILLCAGRVIYRLSPWPLGAYTYVWVLFDRHIEFLLELCDRPHSVREFRRPFVCAAVHRVIVHVLPYPTDLCQTQTIKTQLYKGALGNTFRKAWERNMDKTFKGCKEK